jgi:hypothetical protein
MIQDHAVRCGVITRYTKYEGEYLNQRERDKRRMEKIA